MIIARRDDDDPAGLFEKNSPVNTTKQANRDPLGFLLQAMTLGTGGAIQHQEAVGQRQFVNSTVLPTECSVECRKALESAGVKFGEVVAGDEMFRDASLPEGWKRVASSHSMWSDLLDDKGRKRAAIFYKAASYDRKAHLTASRRYSCQFNFDRFAKDNAASYEVLDGSTVIFSTDSIACAEGAKSWDVMDAPRKAAEEFLLANFPDWRNTAAYWD